MNGCFHPIGVHCRQQNHRIKEIHYFTPLGVHCDTRNKTNCPFTPYGCIIGSNQDIYHEWLFSPHRGALSVAKSPDKRNPLFHPVGVYYRQQKRGIKGIYYFTPQGCIVGRKNNAITNATYHPVRGVLLVAIRADTMNGCFHPIGVHCRQQKTPDKGIHYFTPQGCIVKKQIALEKVKFNIFDPPLSRPIG